MKVAFVDTLYFVALFNPRDQWHERAIAASKLLGDTKLNHKLMRKRILTESETAA